MDHWLTKTVIPYQNTIIRHVCLTDNFRRNLWLLFSSGHGINPTHRQLQKVEIRTHNNSDSQYASAIGTRWADPSVRLSWRLSTAVGLHQLDGSLHQQLPRRNDVSEVWANSRQLQGLRNQVAQTMEGQTQKVTTSKVFDWQDSQRG